MSSSTTEIEFYGGEELDSIEQHFFNLFSSFEEDKCKVEEIVLQLGAILQLLDKKQFTIKTWEKMLRFFLKKVAKEKRSGSRLLKMMLICYLEAFEQGSSSFLPKDKEESNKLIEEMTSTVGSRRYFNRKLTLSFREADKEQFDKKVTALLNNKTPRKEEKKEERPSFFTFQKNKEKNFRLERICMICFLLLLLMGIILLRLMENHFIVINLLQYI